MKPSKWTCVGYGRTHPDLTHEHHPCGATGTAPTLRAARIAWEAHADEAHPGKCPAGRIRHLRDGEQ